MTRRFWQHNSGELYAVEMTADGRITGVCGPLHYSERRTGLDNYNYTSEDIDWVMEHSGEMRDVTTLGEVGKAIGCYGCEETFASVEEITRHEKETGHRP